MAVTSTPETTSLFVITLGGFDPLYRLLPYALSEMELGLGVGGEPPVLCPPEPELAPRWPIMIRLKIM